MAAEATSDLYGFPIRVSPLQKAEREACDAESNVLQPVWSEFIAQEKLPSESKLKELIRKVQLRALVPLPPCVHPSALHLRRTFAAPMIRR